MTRRTESAKQRAATALHTPAARVRESAAEIETRLLVNEGRRSLRAKTATVKKVTKKAVKAGLVTGVATAAAVVVHEVRKRRRQ
jgi:hypothetical protein